jgi:3-dehydroquinate dehydratase-2
MDEIHRSLAAEGKKLGLQVECFQSNAEHELLERVHRARGSADFIIINPGALTHTSIALRDALLAVAIPFIEVHLSNIYAREPFRRHSYLSDAAVGVITGLGAQGYVLALNAAKQRIST